MNFSSESLWKFHSVLSSSTDIDMNDCFTLVWFFFVNIRTRYNFIMIEGHRWSMVKMKTFFKVKIELIDIFWLKLIFIMIIVDYFGKIVNKTKQNISHIWTL